MEENFRRILEACTLLFLISGVGTINACGHLDFYPNGGKHMPGCEDLITPLFKFDLNIYKEGKCFLNCSYKLNEHPSWIEYAFEYQIRSVAQSCPTLCDPMNPSTPGLPVHHQLPEFTQTHVHWVSDAIQPSHPLSSPSPLAPNPSQHQSLFQWVNSSHEVAKLLEFQL